MVMRCALRSAVAEGSTVDSEAEEVYHSSVPSRMALGGTR